MYNIIDYLENTAEIHSKKIAVIEENKKITYRELKENSKKIGSFLVSQNVFNEPIIIFMEKGIHTLVAFFGTIYSGCYYCLINPEHPENRISSISNTLKSKIVITDDEHMTLAKKYFGNLKIFNIKDLIESKIDEDLLEKAKTRHIDYDPLYVNFTSGSTGTPKGVVISHRSTIDFIERFTKLFDFSSDDIIGNQAPFDFDVSVKDIYSAIKVGATLVIIPKNYFSNPAKLLDYICEHKVTNLTWAVSALCLITTFHGLDYKVPSDVKRIIFSGEIMPLKHLKLWMEHLPNTMFVNIYGPTEITCNCTYHIIDKDKQYDDKIPIGIPIPNERVFLLDENDLEVTDLFKSGEICIAGSAVALGYFANKDQTALHFVQNPLCPNYMETIYKTGDLGHYDQDGNLVFTGRKDFQIKYLGHRIELEEIDKAMMGIEEIIRSCCIFEEEKSRIYGFYIGQIDKKDLHNKLKEILPTYMIPTKLIQKEVFPMTKNGKIDRKKLMEDEK